MLVSTKSIHLSGQSIINDQQVANFNANIRVSDPTTGKWYLLLMIYVDYISFDENINYSPEFYPNN